MDRFFSLLDDLESDEYIQSQTQRKRILILKFIAGPLTPTQPKEIPLTGEKRLYFGCEEGKDVAFVMQGERIVSWHMEIVYDHNTLVLKNLNLNSTESCGVYRRLFEGEAYSLRPGNSFWIGTLEFLVERYNTGIVSDIG